MHVLENNKIQITIVLIKMLQDTELKNKVQKGFTCSQTNFQSDSERHIGHFWTTEKNQNDLLTGRKIN